MRRQPRVLRLGTFILLVCAAATIARPEHARKYEALDKVLARVPRKAKGQPNPFDRDAEAIAAGRKLFGQHCEECHGAAADGSSRGPSLRPAVQEAQPGEFFWIITNGVVRHGMPAWSKLPDAQRWQIVSYLGGLRGSDSDRK